MKNPRIYFCFIFAILIAGKISAQEKNIDFISVDSIPEHLVLDKGWKFHSGDNMEWVKKNFNDSTWDRITKQRFPTMVEIPPEKFKGICWLRLHLKMDSALAEKSITLGLIPIGAAEVYVDGKLLKNFGQVGTSAKNEIISVSSNWSAEMVRFSKTKDHVIAIRFSNWRDLGEDKGFMKGFSLTGFSCFIGDWEKFNDSSVKSGKIISTIIGFLIGFFCALSLLHLLLYLFFRRNRSNLYYSIFSASLFGFCWMFANRLMGTTYESSSSDFTGVFLIAALLISFIGFLHTQFYEKVPKTFWMIMGLSVLYVLLKLFYEKYSGYVSAVLFLFVAVEAIRVVILAIKRKKDGAKIIGAGVLIAIIFPIISIILIAILFLGNSVSTNSSSSVPLIATNVMIWSSVLSISISMSIYLARQFATTNKGLERQIIQIRELSEKTIEQEQERKKILESQKDQLEIQVAERTAEVVKQKEEIEEKSAKLQEAYKDVRDSIQYAKRIQESILPADHIIQTAFPNSFVYYKPKDIVSGDFYWFHQTDEKLFIAAADCTGHGVPGAFMSTIGTENLNDAVTKSSELGVILNLTNKGMKRILHQSSNEDSTRDGMDIALCSFNSDFSKMEYSGANRPLWMIRNKSDLLEELKATKVAIGGLTEIEQQFTTHTLQLNKGDTIYISTDGYADQFSANDKKLMTKRFKEILVSIQDKPMLEQKEFLHSFLEKWQRNVEQVDDILIIGIRI